jgi:serine/threonine protein phosphatase PrpC
LLHQIPLSKVVPLRTEPAVTTIEGPTKDITEFKFDDVISAKSISTYPLKGNGERKGDPICDQFNGKLFANGSIIALADGCGWGEPVREAARCAVDTFVTYMTAHINEAQTTRDIATIMLRAYNESHNQIVKGRTEENMFEAGTTTMLGAVIIEVKESSRYPWLMLAVSLGDCRAYQFTTTGKMVDVTAGNRKNVSDPKDPGGRLGPSIGNGKPDLRNLDLYWTPCAPGDMVILMTDGVTDNLGNLDISCSLISIRPTEHRKNATGFWVDCERKFVARVG